MNREQVKKIARIASTVLLFLIVIACGIAMILAMIAKRADSDAPTLFGYQLRVVTTDSMAECDLTDVSDYEVGSIPAGSLVFIKTMPEDVTEAEAWCRDLKVGDVLTFRYTYAEEVTITHRIIAITEKETGGYLIELAGDNKNSTTYNQLTQTIDTSIAVRSNYIVGKVTGQSELLGTIAGRPTAILLMVLLVGFLVILIEAIRFVSLLQKQGVTELKDELADLQRRLADIETRLGDTAEPAEPEESVEPEESIEPEESVEPEEPTEPEEPAEPATPADETEQ